MADVRPFRGLGYNTERVADISSVISPPYDIISPEEQRFLHEQSPYNVVRLELGEDHALDSLEENRYTRAAATLNRWLEENVLVRQPVPAFNVFEHRFTHRGVEKRRWGLNASVRLGDQRGSGARPHEVILESRIQDRLNLLRSCGVNLSPILGMVRHEPGGLLSLLTQVASGEPDLAAVDHEGVVHNMWVVTDSQSIAEISAWFADKAIYIADGHHRYETALAYQGERQAAASRCTGQEAFNFVMMTLTDVADPGLVALPAHRLVRLARPGRLGELREELGGLFDLEYHEAAGSTWTERLKVWLRILEERARKRVAMGVYGLDAGRLCLLMPRELQRLDAMMPEDRSQDWKNLDVSILHCVILRQMIGVATPQKEDDHLKYTHDEEEAIARVESGEYHLAFLMNPVPISSVLAVADAGDRMPPKSTYFYPKLPTGLVMYPLWDGEP